MAVNNEFPKRLKALRRSGDLTQKEFSELIGISEQSVIRWEKGSIKPGLEALQKVCEAFPAFSVEWLVMGRGEMYLSDLGEGIITEQAQWILWDIKQRLSHLPSDEKDHVPFISKLTASVDLLADHLDLDALHLGSLRMAMHYLTSINFTTIKKFNSPQMALVAFQLAKSEVFDEIKETFVSPFQNAEIGEKKK